MIYSDLYGAALRLISETEDSIATDYEERAPYLLGSFVTEQIPLQKKWDASHGNEIGSYAPSLHVTMSDDFPLADDFIIPATYYLAAMLVLDENEALSDRFFDRYIDGVAQISLSLPMTTEKIADRYHVNR